MHSQNQNNHFEDPDAGDLHPAAYSYEQDLEAFERKLFPMLQADQNSRPSPGSTAPGSQSGETPEDAPSENRTDNATETPTKTPTENYQKKLYLQAVRHHDREAEKRFGDLCHLTEIQLRAIDLAVIGRTDTQIAAELGLNRKTIWRWKTYDVDFRDGLQDARAESNAYIADRYQTMLLRASGVLYLLLEDENPANRFKAAYALLSMSRSFRRELPKPNQNDQNEGGLGEPDVDPEMG